MSEHGRIEWEAPDSLLGEAVAQRMVEQTYPCVFAGGKQIVRTEASTAPNGDNYITFWFSDGSMMSVVGQFDVRYKPADVDSENNMIDAEIVDEEEPKELEA